MPSTPEEQIALARRIKKTPLIASTKQVEKAEVFGLILNGQSRKEVSDLLIAYANEVLLGVPEEAAVEEAPVEEALAPAPAPELPTASPITPPAPVKPKRKATVAKPPAPAPAPAPVPVNEVVEEAPAPAADPDYIEEAEYAWVSVLTTEEERKAEFIKLSVRVRELEAQLAKKPTAKVADTFVAKEGKAYKYEIHADHEVAVGTRKEMSADEKVNARRAYQRERYRQIYALKKANERKAKNAEGEALLEPI
jgi:hypothetical protein